MLWLRKQAGEMWKQQDTVCTAVAVLCFSAQHADTLQCHLLLSGLTVAEKALGTWTQLKLQSDTGKWGAGALWNKGLDLAKPLVPAPAWSTVPVSRATRQRTKIHKEHRWPHYLQRKFHVRTIYPKLMPGKRILEWKHACRNIGNLVKGDDMFMKNNQEGEQPRRERLWYSLGLKTGILLWTSPKERGKGGSSTCLFLHGRSFPLRFSTAYQILFEIAHWTWDSRCLITHLIRLSRSLVMQPPASSSHHFWSEVKTHLHMPENTPIMGRLGKELWKQSSATPYGLCTPKKLLKSCGNVFQRRSLQNQCICAVKSLCWHGLLFPPQCCWCYQFCILSCIVSTEVSLLPWGSPQGLQVLENRNKCHPETHPASSWLFRLPPELHQ